MIRFQNQKVGLYHEKRILSIMLTLLLTFSMIPAASLTTYAATSARISSSLYCAVKISQSLINKRGKRYATVKIKTYDMSGWYNTGAKVRITLRDGNGNYICSWVGKGGDTLKFGDDHHVYRIYVSYYDNPGNNLFRKEIALPTQAHRISGKSLTPKTVAFPSR